MQLSTSDRRSVVENLLDIDVFSTMNILVKQDCKCLRNSLGTSKNRNIKDKVKVKKNYIDSAKEMQASVDKFKEEIAVAKGQVDTLNEQIGSLEEVDPN